MAVERLAADRALLDGLGTEYRRAAEAQQLEGWSERIDAVLAANPGIHGAEADTGADTTGHVDGVDGPARQAG